MRYVGLHDGRHNQLKWCRSGNEWKHMTLVASNTSRPHLAPGPFRAFSSSHPGCGKLNTTASILAKSTGVRSHLVGVSSSSRRVASMSVMTAAPSLPSSAIFARPLEYSVSTNSWE